MLRVKVTRSPKHKVGIFKKMSVIVDGKEMAALKVGETKKFRVAKDSREIWVKMGWSRSVKIGLNHGEGKCSFVCGEENFMLSLLYTFLYPVKAFSLRKTNT